MSNDTARAGHGHGLRQPCITANLQVDTAGALDLAAIDGWLQDAFAISPREAGEAAGARPALQVQARAIAWRVMLLAAVLLRAVRLPVFEPGRVLDATPREGGTSWDVRVAVGRVDHVPAQVHATAYEIAAQALRWMAAKTESREATVQLWTMLERAFVDRFQSLGVGGASTMAVLEAAFDKGIPFRHLGAGTYQLGWGSAARRFDRGAVQFDSAIGGRMTQDKLITAAVLRDAGLPAPVHVPVSTQEQALAAAAALGWPVVVKPVDRDRGEGVTVSVDSEAALIEAYAHAASFSKRILVERQVEGVCHRIVIAGERVPLVSKRRAKSVTGDGLHTVRQLVEQANEAEQAKPPWDRLKPFPLDDLALECLAAVGMTPDTVPAQDVFVPLRKVQSTADGGAPQFLTEAAHPDNIEIAKKAARLFGLALAGIDIITPDIARPWHENGAIINEVNFSSVLPNRQSAHALPELLSAFFEKDGRVPVVVVVGGDAAFARGEREQAAMKAQGLACWLTSDTATVSPEGRHVALAAQGLFARSTALSLDPQVDAIVMVVQTDELLRTGLPFDRFARIVDAGAKDRADLAWHAPMKRLLEAYRTDSM